MWRRAGLHNAFLPAKRAHKCCHPLQTFMDAFGQQQTLPHDGIEGSGVYVREVLPRLPTGLRRGVDVP
jgi:hypothetical protein